MSRTHRIPFAISAVGCTLALVAAAPLSATAGGVCPPEAVSQATNEPAEPPVGVKELSLGAWPMSGYRLVIPAIDLDEPIARSGGSGALDAGHVVNLTGCWPDSQCTVYVAGHNTSHGSVFNLVDDLEVGSEVILATHDDTRRYAIESKTLLCRLTTTLADVAIGDLVLQTSRGSDEVWILQASETDAEHFHLSQ